MPQAEILKDLSEALDEWEYSSLYKGDYLRKKHGDLERIREIREKYGIKKGGRENDERTKPNRRPQDPGAAGQEGAPGRR